jgi:hypothetical protein
MDSGKKMKKDWYKKNYAALNMFISTEEREWIANYLIEKNKPDKVVVKYNEEDALFYWDKVLLKGKETEVPEEEVKDAYEKLWGAEKTTQELEDMWDVISYFYNDVYLDDNGFYRQKNFLSKKVYLTRYELDDINRRYEELHKE